MTNHGFLTKKEALEMLSNIGIINPSVRYLSLYFNIEPEGLSRKRFYPKVDFEAVRGEFEKQGIFLSLKECAEARKQNPELAKKTMRQEILPKVRQIIQEIEAGHC